MDDVTTLVDSGAEGKADRQMIEAQEGALTNNSNEVVKMRDKSEKDDEEREGKRKSVQEMTEKINSSIKKREEKVGLYEKRTFIGIL